MRLETQKETEWAGSPGCPVSDPQTTVTSREGPRGGAQHSHPGARCHSHHETAPVIVTSVRGASSRAPPTTGGARPSAVQPGGGEAEAARGPCDRDVC